MRPAFGVLLVTAALVATGCNQVYFSDDIDLDFNFSLLTGPSDSLHLPYVVGTRVVIYANSTGDDDDDDRFWLQSSNPAVLRIDSQSEGRAECTALSAGESTISVFESRHGEPLDSTSVQVAIPTRVELLPAGPLMVDHPDLRSRRLDDNRAQVLVEGTATFLVRYYRGGARLHGNGVLETSSSDAVQVTEETSFLFENREWLQVTPQSTGSYPVALRASGYSVGQLNLDVVGSWAVGRVELFGENEGDAADGEILAVLAQALDATGEPIYGVDFTWDLDGTSEPGAGDLFYYEFRPGETARLGAGFEGRRAEAFVSADEGWVSSSNIIGCAVTPGLPADNAALPIVVLFLTPLVMLTRSRRRGV